VTEDDAIRIVRSYIEGLFPKVCANCGRRFGSLRDYFKLTTHLGSPYLSETAGAETSAPSLGPIAYASCVCGNTLSIGSQGLPKAQLVELMMWAKADAYSLSISTTQLLRELRDRIDHEVLRDQEVLRDDESSSLRHRRLTDPHDTQPE
jgi:hypothetical protein